MTSPAEARHRIANLLAEYCRAVDEQDSVAVGTLLADTQLVFRGQHVTGRDNISNFYAAAFAAPTTTQHTVSNLWVDSAGNRTAVRYRAAYQRWTINDEPRCSAVGTYIGQVEPDGNTWRWIAHEVHTITPPQS